jgi:hypothetical protein
MMTTTKSYLTLLAMFCAIYWNRPVIAQSASLPSREQSRTLTPKQINDVIAAVVDEIYDYSQESSYIFAGTTTKDPMDRSATLPLCIAPEVDGGGTGRVIYKDLPYGEILRDFHIRPDGMVILDSDPQIGFPETQPSHLTKFMDSGELRQDKLRWIRREFKIRIDPPRQVVVDAANRQVKRVGFSDFLTTIGKSKCE